MKMKKNNIKNSFFSLFLLLSNLVFAQKITSQVIDESGGTHRANGYTMTYSIGQTAVETLKGNNYIITQGFQQANKNTTINAKDEVGKISFEAIIFPNPTQDILNLRIENSNTDDFKIMLYNMAGQQISRGSFSGKTHQIEVSQLPVGEYIIYLQTIDNQNFMTSKFIKI
jgi:hypothetical protein